jgi:Phage integrase family
VDSVLLDAAGHRRSPATMPGYHRGRPPRNKGEEYPADPPTIEEIVAVMRAVGDRPDGHRLRALILLLWRAGLRISEALAVQERDLDRGRGAVLVRRGKGGKRREVGMDRWAWEQLDPWLEIRRELPIGALLCVIHGPTAGRRWEPSAARQQLHHAAAAAGVRRRFAPHQLRHAHAIEMAHEVVPLVVIQRQLGHANLGITSIYLPTGHRQQRDHQHRPWTALTDDLRQRGPPDEAIAPTRRVWSGVPWPTRRHPRLAICEPRARQRRWTCICARARTNGGGPGGLACAVFAQVGGRVAYAWMPSSSGCNSLGMTATGALLLLIGESPIAASANPRVLDCLEARKCSVSGPAGQARAFRKARERRVLALTCVDGSRTG